jgi:hypothetical protein
VNDTQGDQGAQGEKLTGRSEDQKDRKITFSEKHLGVSDLLIF